MTKITLESGGISVCINNSNLEEDDIESIGFAFLGKIAEEALNKINNKRKLNKLVSEDLNYSEKEESEESESEDEEEDEEYEEEDDEEDDEDDEEDEDEEEEDDEEDSEEDNQNEDSEEDFKKSNKESNKSNKKQNNSVQCLKYIRNNKKDELIKIVNKINGKISIKGTTKEQRNWVYQIFSEIENISTWSFYGKNGRVMVIDSLNKN